MNKIEIEKAIQILKANNENEILDEVIDKLLEIIDNSEYIEYANDYGITFKEAMDAANVTREINTDYPFDIDNYDEGTIETFNDGQLKLVAHILNENETYVIDAYDDEVKTRDEVYCHIVDDPESYFDIDEKIDEEMDTLCEDDIYDRLKVMVKVHAE